MVMEEAMDSDMSLSNMVLSFLEEGETERWPENNDDDIDEGSSGSCTAESKAFWQAQHSQLHEALAKTSTAESRIRAVAEDAMEKTRAVCSCARRAAAGDCRSCLLRRVAGQLRDAGYNGAICRSKWTRSLDIPAVTGCRKLRDTELFSRQDPYVIVEYASTKLRTSTCSSGGTNPSFDDKFHIPLIEGLRELNVLVWNSNTISKDVFIGSCKVQLNKVLASGYDDAAWPLQTRSMKYAGEVKLIMQFDVAAMMNKMGGHCAPSMPPSSPYAASSGSSYTSPSLYPATPPHLAYQTPGHAPYPSPYAYSAPPPQQHYPHHGYPPTSHHPQPYGQPCPPQPYGQPYPPQPYGQAYPPELYGQQYPPPSPTPSLYPSASFPRAYPPPPY